MGMREASREIGEATLVFLRRRAEHARLRELIRRTDSMIDEVEELNLADRERVPAGWADRLTELAAEVPFAAAPRLEGSLTTAEALEVIYDLQEPLLRARTRSLDPQPAADRLLEAADDD